MKTALHQEGITSLTLPKRSKSILATGGELKNTFCLTKANRAFISPCRGDLKDFYTYQDYQEQISDFKNRFKIEPEIITHDLHPDYLSTRYALENSGFLPRIEVQHHHAHIASCMAENFIEQDVIGVAFDGTGFGLDGNIWGGEFFVGNYAGFERVYHLKYVALAGGDKAVKEPWRMAVSYLYQSFGDTAQKFTSRWKNAKATIAMIKKKINSPLTSSMGRLFDAVSALIGLCDVHAYEADAAIRLERLCENKRGARTYPYQIENGVIDFCPMIRQIAQTKEGPAEIAIRFHATIADIILKVCQHLREKYALSKVVFSGGVFQNKVLLDESLTLLKEHGFGVFIHSKVPPTDAGISLGQAAIANFAFCNCEQIEEKCV